MAKNDQVTRLAKVRPGVRVGRLVVIRKSSKWPNPKWECKCDCGTVRSLWAGPLISGRTKSCGCARVDHVRDLGHRNRVHGKSRSKNREYRSWEAAKRRCFNTGDPQYRRYGGRGITMCERWKESFVCFMDDMGPCPPDHTIDRINNDGNYEPSNCRWATLKEQNDNRSSTDWVEWNGEKKSLTEWARCLGMRQATLRYRLRIMMWPVERAFTEAVSRHSRRRGQTKIK